MGHIVYEVSVCYFMVMYIFSKVQSYSELEPFSFLHAADLGLSDQSTSRKSGSAPSLSLWLDDVDVL